MTPSSVNLEAIDIIAESLDCTEYHCSGCGETMIISPTLTSRIGEAALHDTIKELPDKPAWCPYCGGKATTHESPSH